MHDRTRRRLTAAGTAAAALTLAACGVGSASHVVQGTAPGTTPTTQVSTSSTVAVSTPVTSASTTTIASSSTLNTQTLDQVAAQLGTVNSNLQQVNSDLNNPQGDS